MCVCVIERERERERERDREREGEEDCMKGASENANEKLPSKKSNRKKKERM